MASAVAPPKTPKTTTSTSPLYTQAVAQAKAALAAAQAPIRAEQTQSDQQFAQRQTDATGNAAALADLLKNIGPQVAHDYTAAAQNQSLLGAGFSHGMQDALQGNTDNLNAMLEKLGSPTHLDSHAQEAGDVVYGLGGYIPATTFNRGGAAFTAAADMLPGTALLKGQEEVKSLRGQAVVADKDFQNKLSEMAGNLPGEIADNYSKFQSLALDNAKFREQVRQDNFDQAYKTAQQKLSVAKYQTDAAYKQAQVTLSGQRNQLSGQRLNLEAQKFATQTFQQDRNYGLALQRLGISKKSLQLRIAQNEAKVQAGGFSAKDIAKFNVKLDAAIATMPEGTTYSDFLKQSLKNGIPLSLALKKANLHFPETQRSFDPALMQLPDAAKQWKQQLGAYNKMTGVTLGTSPNGQDITWSAPKGLSGTTRKKVQAMLGLASEYLGTPYAWGGESPTGFDCSGLAQYIYGKVGISIPRTTYDQFKSGLNVPRSQLQPGDLVFFKGSDSKGGLPGHVGIYVGGGKMVQAPHTGDVVKVSSISGFPGYMGARRYVH